MSAAAARHPAGLCLALLALAAPAQARAQEVAGRPVEEAVTQLRYQWEAAFLGGAAVARANGQSLEDYGAQLGRLLAPSWGDDLTAGGFARGMGRNFLLIGQDAEATVAGGDALVRWTRLDPLALERRNGDLGFTLEEYERLLTAVVSSIAAEHGLRWDERTEGDRKIARVTRR